MPRLLIINPNTTAAMTRKVGDAARDFLPDVAVVEATGRFGGAYIASRASYAIAGHAALDCLAEHGAGCDTVLLACFGDPGLDALREVSPVPVVGLIDAATAEAGRKARRFAIVTGGDRWKPMLEEMLRQRGLDGQLAGIRTVAPTGGDIARDPEGSLAILHAAVEQCVQETGAEAVILGGAGLMGLAARLQPQLEVPVVCSIEAGFRASREALAATARPPAGALYSDPAATTGLSPALTGLLAGAG